MFCNNHWAVHFVETGTRFHYKKSSFCILLQQVLFTVYHDEVDAGPFILLLHCSAEALTSRVGWALICECPGRSGMVWLILAPTTNHLDLDINQDTSARKKPGSQARPSLYSSTTSSSHSEFLILMHATAGNNTRTTIIWSAGRCVKRRWGQDVG